jgi:hypothetical protein
MRDGIKFFCFFSRFVHALLVLCQGVAWAFRSMLVIVD